MDARWITERWIPRASSNMASRDQELRLGRARLLAGRYPHAAEALQFYSHLVSFDGDAGALRRLVMRHGPQLLRDAAAANREPALGFYDRVLMRLHPPPAEAPHSNRCPRCGQPPQAGVLHPEGHGATFHLLCSLCLEQWRFPRAQCPRCGEEKLSYHTADSMPHVHVQMCEACGCYLHVVDLEKDPAAQPDVDEIAALALDVWAIDQGYEKIHPNLIGI
ncbi:MAG: formate dehydrogenase accessory protein FdhE [Bryobacteraceae bacterium]